MTSQALTHPLSSAHGQVERVSKAGELAGIQLLRGIAASFVVLHHTLEESLYSQVGPMPPDWLVTFGAAGVDIFFVISGFIMLYVSYPDGGGAVQPLSFLWKRATRIFPLYWACAALVFLLHGIGFFSSNRFELGDNLLALLLLPSKAPILGVAWTLVFEIYFYLVFACSLLFRSRLLSLSLTSAAILILYLLGHLLPPGPLRSVLTDPIAFEFCFGLFLAYLFVERRLPLGALHYAWTVGLVAICAAPLVVAHDSTNGLPSPMRILAWGLPACLILASCLALRGMRPGRWRYAHMIGDASYSIYLTHPFVMVAYAWLLRKIPGLAAQPQWPVVPLIVGAAILTGLVTYRLVERRLTPGLKRKAIRPRVQPSAIAAGADGGRA